MNRLRFLALVAVCFTPAALAHATANVLQNAGFELDAVMNDPPLAVVSNWSTFGNFATASAPTSPVRTGIGSLRLEGAGGYSVPGAFQEFPASPGQLWDLQGYIRTEDPLLAGDERGLLKIVFGGAAGDLEPGSVIIGTADAQPFPGIISDPQLTAASPADTWVFVHAQGVAPVDTIAVRFFALFVDGAGPGVAFFDDIQAALAGDFDADLDVDSDDYALWKGGFGANASGDADGDADSDGIDFLLWQRFFNPTVGGAGAIPEPASAVLLAAGLALAACKRSRGRTR